jgi:adenosine deaminase CECR1
MANMRSHIAVRRDMNGNPLPLPGNKTSKTMSMSEYQAQRTQMIEEEKSHRFDADKLSRLTEEERRANEVVEELKKEEETSIYNKKGDSEAIKGMDWEGAKVRGVREGKLYRLVQQMPKGAILHCHLDATVDPSWVVEKVLQVDNFYMLSSAPLTTPTSLFTSQVQFRVLPKEANLKEEVQPRASSSAQDIFAETYQPDTWVPLHQAKAQFPYGNVYGESNDAFKAYLYSLITLKPVLPSFAPPIKTSKQAWTKFLSTFQVIGGFIRNEAILKDYIIESFQTYINDGVTYIEPRINFFLSSYIDGNGNTTLNNTDLCKTFEAALKEVQSKQPLGKTFDAKIIYSTVRIIDNERLRWYVEEALSLKQQFPHLLVGFDLVGHEDPGVTLLEYVPELLRFKERVIELGLDFPLVLHAGETTSDGDETDNNLYDAIILGTKRIGHGFSLIKHPHLIDLVKERGICVENCPISNQILRFANSTAVHPVLPLLARSVPVVISNDDPTQFDNAGVTPDFYQLLSASEHITLSSLGVLARNSITYSLMGDDQKAVALEQWDSDWAAFVGKVASKSL